MYSRVLLNFTCNLVPLITGQLERCKPRPHIRKGQMGNVDKQTSFQGLGLKGEASVSDLLLLSECGWLLYAGCSESCGLLLLLMA